MLQIVALDVSLRATGVASNIGGPPAAQLIVPGMRTGAERLLYIKKMIDQVTDQAHLVLREGYAFGAKGSAIFDIAELGGVVRLTLYCRKRPLVEIPPSVVKKLATGNGGAKKDAVLAAAIRRLGYQGDDHNEADALFLLQAGLHHYGLPGAVDLPKSHLATIDRVKWPELKP